MLNIIQGKPGSGKSYLAVKKIADLLTNLVEDEKRTGHQCVRRVYTNIQLILTEIDTYVEHVTMSGIRASKYITLLDNSFFWEVGPDGVNQLSEWWDKFADGAFIVIDEVQYYLASNSNDKKADGYNKNFELYISTHRHKAQDIIFITQHQDNILRSCLSMSEGTYIVTNYKNFILPWLGIPVSDFDVVRHAWGSDSQAANVQYGLFVGRAYHRQSSEIMVMEQSIFNLYKSHNNNIDSDRPNLNLSKIGSIFWLIRRHALQLSIKIIFVVVFLVLVLSLFKSVPAAFGKLFGAGKKTEINLDNVTNTPIIRPDSEPTILIPKVVAVFNTKAVLDNGQVIHLNEVFDYGANQFELVQLNYNDGFCRFRRVQSADGTNPAD